MSIAIQIGTNNGHDEFAQMCRIENFSKVYLVEPLVENNESIRAEYDGIPHLVYNMAIVNNDWNDHVELYDLSKNGQHDSLCNRKTHPLREQVKKFSSRTVPCMSINGFLAWIDKREIDLLCIDTEGLDDEIILSIDFSKVSIRRIIWEVWGHENDDENGFYRTGPTIQKETISKLEGMGYLVSKHAFGPDDESNWIAVKGETE
jgi:FkbM family methyltransferase